MSKPEGNATDLETFLQNLGLERFLSTKLTLKEVLNIRSETWKKIEHSDNVFWYFLQKVFALNVNARVLNSIDTDNDHPDIDTWDLNNDSTKNLVSPHDVVCALLHRSDMFLQQEIIRKMSMCQFAVPLILPAVDGSNSCTFMLFGLRDIVKRWTPKEQRQQKRYAEESVVLLSIPVLTFVRLGENVVSKSKILNQILSPEEQVHDFFVHLDLNGGNAKRKIADGLVEVAWYFPSGRDSDLFHDPIAFANLRGDLQNNKKQFDFLSEISQTLFILIDQTNAESLCFTDLDVSNKNYFFIIRLQSFKVIDGKFKIFLENLSDVKNRKYLFVINKSSQGSGRDKSMISFLKEKFPDINQNVFTVEPRLSEERQIARRLQSLLRDLTSNMENKSNLEDMARVADHIRMDVDENYKQCKDTKTLAQEITKSIHNVAVYKIETMKLQGDPWVELGKLEKELCQMKYQHTSSGEQYKSELNNKIIGLRRQQSQQSLSEGIHKFLDALSRVSTVELSLFFKWLKFYVDEVSRHSILKVQHTSEHETVADRNLGIEHFIRELGQLYEAECFMKEKGEIGDRQSKFHHLPEVGAQLLLDGFPLELIDGDASNVPVQWISDVLKELDNKTGGKCIMKVISVLGVQSTGKSTLLNTMFGLQLPVASGRCTRGAFMTLLRVEENFQEELGCDFLLVLDTEGLRAPEFSSHREHDSELATLVVGLSDITIVNLSMENSSEMEDILQIVVHAFLRMKQIGKKPSCQFVHQNVSDVSAHDKIMREKQFLLKKLDDLTKVAAKMEKYHDVTQFSQIIKYDIESSNWYIPGLWHGVPPMASVSTGYSEKVYELKQHLLEYIKQIPCSDSCNIKEFIEWIRSLWNAVKHEKFLFSFRNSLVADSYNELCKAYSQQEWTFRKEVYSWMIEKENEIKNLNFGKEEQKLITDLKNQVDQMLKAQMQNMEHFLNDYFDKDKKHVKWILDFKNDFFTKLPRLRKELEYHLNNKFMEVIRIQKEKNELNSMQATYQERIEEEVNALLENCRQEKRKVSYEELESEFLIMWDKTLMEFNLRGLEKQDISMTMLDHLKRNMVNKANYIQQKLNKIESLEKYQKRDFQMKMKYIKRSLFEVTSQIFEEDFWQEATAVALTIIDRCDRYIINMTSTQENYHETFCQQLLDIVSDSLQEKHVQKFNFKPSFEICLKRLALGKAAPMFQKMHDDYIQENDPKLRLEKLKPLYLNKFKEIYMHMDDCRERAQRFCDFCLKPALIWYVYSHLANNITDDVLTSYESVKYGSRTFFQMALLNDLLTQNIFAEYVKYCLQYEIFVKDWITKYVTVRYAEPGRLKELISECLTSITKKVRKSFQENSVLQCKKLSESLKCFCEILRNDLVISQNNLKVIIFPDNESVHQFFQYVEPFLCDIEDQILNELSSLSVESVLYKFSIKPQDELLKRVFGCGQQCPFCKVPCEAGGVEHKEHFSSMHRPQGLGSRNKDSNRLCYKLCSTDVVTNCTFQCQDTNWQPHPYRDYRQIYPDWKIQPDPSIIASVYWKYVFKEFNQEFAKEYKTLPAELPEDWKKITREQAFNSIKIV